MVMVMEVFCDAYIYPLVVDASEHSGYIQDLAQLRDIIWTDPYNLVHINIPIVACIVAMLKPSQT